MPRFEERRLGDGADLDSICDHPEFTNDHANRAGANPVAGTRTFNAGLRWKTAVISPLWSSRLRLPPKSRISSDRYGRLLFRALIQILGGVPIQSAQ
jgi:hypothetical protein